MGKVFDIQRMSVHDGPGIRTTVFLKGCPLNCQWCHNPEGIDFDNGVWYDKGLCINCGECVKLCRNGAISLTTNGININTFCKKCFMCAEYCPAKAITKIAEEYMLEDLVQEILKDKEYFDVSGGGVTVSGGEPLLQNDIEEFISRVKELGYSVKLDTNGTFPDKLKDLVNRGLIDYVAMDIKNSPARYPETVGISGFDVSGVRASVALLLEGRVDYEFRTTAVHPLHSEEAFFEIADFIRGARRYFIQNFVDSGALIGEGMSGFDEISRKSNAAFCRYRKR